ncbi:MAG: amino acid ABC transporter ATP-binding protein [Eubacteriales bacterium]|nr:amino acid ABC transporter ATP-binding protein [Eubacteriales bacterium]
MQMLRVENLKKSFGSEEVLKDVSFAMEQGETLAVIGSSGSGKSTMLRCLIDLEQADGGDIVIEGEYLLHQGAYPAEKEKRRICAKMGMVFQSFNLFPHITVLDNLMYAPLYVKKDGKAQALERARELLKMVDLLDKQDVYPNSLSGGQKQRVAIARALMTNPDMLLFDEPTSSLDPQLTGEVLSVMKDLARRRMTMIVVTHEMGFAREAADRVLFMGDGRILEQGPPAQFFAAPRDKRVREFINSIL